MYRMDSTPSPAATVFHYGAEVFEGMTLVAFDANGQICFLKEFGCNLNRYDPYCGGPKPQFSNEQARWF